MDLMRETDRTTSDRLIIAFILVSAIIVGLIVVVWGNDKGSATEVGLLQGTLARTHATDAQCDAMYHAIWKVKQEPSHSTLIDIAKGLDCPFSE